MHVKSNNDPFYMQSAFARKALNVKNELSKQSLMTVYSKKQKWSQFLFRRSTAHKLVILTLLIFLVSNIIDYIFGGDYVLFPPRSEERVCAVIPSWGRPALVQRTLDKYCRYDAVQEIIITHGQESTYFNHTPCNKVRHYYDEDLNQKYGLLRRYMRAQNCSSEYVLSIDDDKTPSNRYIKRLVLAAQADKERIYGDTMRWCNPSDGYTGYSDWWNDALYINPYKQYDTILTNMALIGRPVVDMIVEKFETARDMPDGPFQAVPLWNGEDLFANAVLRHYFQKQGIFVRPGWFDLFAPIELLNRGTAIHTNNPGHFSYRANFCRTIWKYLH